MSTFNIDKDTKLCDLLDAIQSKAHITLFDKEPNQQQLHSLKSLSLSIPLHLKEIIFTDLLFS